MALFFSLNPWTPIHTTRIDFKMLQITFYIYMYSALSSLLFISVIVLELKHTASSGLTEWASVPLVTATEWSSGVLCIYNKINYIILTKLRVFHHHLPKMSWMKSYRILLVGREIFALSYWRLDINWCFLHIPWNSPYK